MKRKRNELEILRGIGPSLAEDLQKIGVTSLIQLKKSNAGTLFKRLERKQGKTDPCVLYTFRCAIYQAQAKHPTKEKSNWWYWKDIKKRGNKR